MAGEKGGQDKKEKSGKRRKFWIFLGVAAVAAIGFFVGTKVADDSKVVKKQKAQIKRLTAQRTGLQENVNSLERQVVEADQENAGEENPDSGDLAIGREASVGDFTLKPVSVKRRASGRYRATVMVTNGSTEPASPFCGGGAELIDETGRSFDGEPVTGNGSDGCDALEPGLTGSIQIEFRTPAGAQPAVLELAPVLLEDESGTWTI